MLCASEGLTFGHQPNALGLRTVVTIVFEGFRVSRIPLRFYDKLQNSSFLVFHHEDVLYF